VCVRCCPSQCAALLAPPNGSAGVDLRSGRHLVYVYGETIMTGTRAMFDRRLNSTVQQLMQCPAIKPHVIAAITWRPTGALPKLPSVEFQRLAGVRTFVTLNSRPRTPAFRTTARSPVPYKTSGYVPSPAFKCPSPGGSAPPSRPPNTVFLGPTRVCPPQTASRSIRPFLHGSSVCPVVIDTQRDTETTLLATDVEKCRMHCVRVTSPAYFLGVSCPVATVEGRAIWGPIYKLSYDNLTIIL